MIDGRTRNGSTMTDTKTRPVPSKTAPSKKRGLGIAAAAFATIVVVVVAAVSLTGGSDGEPAAGSTSTTAAEASTTSTEATTTTTELSGRALEGAAGVAGVTGIPVDGPGTEPDEITFNEDGTYEVVDRFTTVDTGVYTTSGDEITFESLVENQRLDYVDWVHQPENELFRSACEDVVGRYTLTWLTSTRFVINVISDSCGRRTGVANGLEIEVELP